MEAGLGRMTPEDFVYTDHQVLFRLVRQSLEQDATDVGDYLRQNLPPSLENLVDELAAKPGELDPVDDRLLEDLFRAVIRIMREKINEDNTHQSILIKEAQESGDKEIIVWHQRNVQINMIRQRQLDQAQLKQNGRRKE